MTARVQEAQQLFANGLAHHRAGRHAAARQCYEAGLALLPGQPDASFLLGQLLFEIGEHASGEVRMRAVIAAHPAALNYRQGLAIQLFNAGRFGEARLIYEELLSSLPAGAAQEVIRREYALTLTRAGEVDAAIVQWQALTHGTTPDAWRQLARLYADTGRDDLALAAIDRQLARPLHAAASAAGVVNPVASAALVASARAGDWCTRADIHERQGEREAMLGDLLEAVALTPDDAALRGRLGLALLRAGLGDAAREQLDRAASLAPEEAAWHFNRGLAYAAAGLRETACAAYERALALAPEAPATLTNLANQYAALSRPGEATALYARALAADPEFAPAHFNLAMAQLDAGCRLDAAESLAAAAALDPENGLIAAHLLFQRLHLCRWDGLVELQQRVIRAIDENSADVPPFIVLSMPGTTPQLQRRCAENRSAALARGLASASVAEAPASAASARSPGQRLRVGYLSSDFKNHATAFLMIEMLDAHDRERFEVIGLSYGVDDGSAMRARVAASVERFVDLAGLPTREAVAQIAALQLDVLIDLKGYTEGNHSEWLQYRLAPVQINWLGYPGTLGAPWVDYLIADPVVAPLEHQWMFSERLLHLPASYQPNCRQRASAPPSTRAAEGLPEGALVLCSFNQTYKITPEIFAVWLDVLRQVPQSVLWLWASNPWAERELRRVAEAAGIAPARLVFAEGRAQAEHLARLPLADIALDTFPCNGHTTSSDALWAGVPVISLQGEAFAERVAASLLVAAGLPELVATSREAYRALILRVCTDADWRQSITARARALRVDSPLFDSVAFARRLESLLLDAHRQPLAAGSADRGR
ncbi:tetratricopeptide repeat protein [Rhodocyclus gracilis]|uniref:protein O-GlcNAc transferase n=1 Tax=Rhodocyclus tenuis TaxID=1066 RepID=A0A6L5JX20_RHOTE|nr:tetratricopeptide repeat protein [Rhodocyclus gracilis]MQY51571.1 glycosyltransferase [Rhodocyclus gracilis]